MFDCTSESQVKQLLSITDVVEKRPSTLNDVYTAENWHRDFLDISDSSGPHRLYVNIKIADFQRATNQASLRRLGRTAPNATATPETRLMSNRYPDVVTKLEARIKEFLSYTEDWDGEGAKEIPMTAIYMSLNFLDEFRRRFSGDEPRGAAPSPDGEVALYWHGPAGYAEVNFDGGGGLSMCWSVGDEELQLIEEKVEDGAELVTSHVWATLSEFLGQSRGEETMQRVL